MPGTVLAAAGAWEWMRDGMLFWFQRAHSLEEGGERGFRVQTASEEPNVSYRNNSQGIRKNILSIINTRKKQEIWFCCIATKMRIG